MKELKLATSLLWLYVIQGRSPCNVWKCDCLTVTHECDTVAVTHECDTVTVTHECDTVTVTQKCDTVTERCGVTLPGCDSCTSMTPVKDIWTFILMWDIYKNILDICVPVYPGYL